MSRSLEIYSNGQIVERDDDQPIKIIETEGEIKQLLQALKFSRATTFTISSDPSPPEIDIPEPRGGRRINAEGLKLLTTFEGCELHAYDDGVGVWTIGYGHTSGVAPGMTITQAQAEAFLQDDLEIFESAVQDAVSVSITDAQFSALVCFCYNVGAGLDGFGGSTLLRLLNEGNYEGAAEQFLRWNKAGGQPLLGLTRRRKAEQALFLEQAWQPFLTFEEGKVRVLKLDNPLMRGEDVRQVQTALKKVGFSVDADGVFGNGTDQAVRQFQQQKGLIADGVVGAETRHRLNV
ncbi:MAG: glycoside hydrolase family protein [Myxacorys chilensis ATA2-1-KO14]|jgi:GH24 family phage-related lysozyme (muramidase)|nr:glycoside hydrolase family protein [Myxacorys chilensis ATA2-1-KO14]